MNLNDLDLERLRARLSVKWQQYGRECLPAWVAEMDFPVAEPIRATLQRALEHDDFGYPQAEDVVGLPALFAARVHERYGCVLDAERVEVLSDVVQGIYIALMAFTAPGAGVVVQTPVYPPFLDSVKKLGRRLLPCPLVDTGERHTIDFERFAAACQGARVLLLCHPHNPTGRVFTREELTRIAAVAVEHDLLVVSDEIHADLTFAGRDFVPFASLGPELAERTITLSSASKAFNIAGLRCAVAHFGSRALQDRFNVCVPGHARGGVGILGQYCTRAAWQAGAPWLDEVKRTLDENRHFLVGELQRRLPEVGVHLPEATYLAWLDCAKLGLPRSPAAFFIEHARVALSDGAWFGAGFEQCARLNFATSKPILAEILERLISAARAR
jgi:cysteine-S-conjugate beta-lyase